MPANEVLEVAKREVGAHDGLIADVRQRLYRYVLLLSLAPRLEQTTRLALAAELIPPISHVR